MGVASLKTLPADAEVEVLLVSPMFPSEETILVRRTLPTFDLSIDHVLRTKDRETAWRIVSFSYPSVHTDHELAASESFAILERLLGGHRLTQGEILEVIRA